MGFRHENGGNPHFDQPRPQFGVELCVALNVENLVDAQRVAAVAQQILDRREKGELVFGEEEIHAPAPCTRSRGRPRLRSAMMLRWMFDVPPAIDIDSEIMKRSIHLSRAPPMSVKSSSTMSRASFAIRPASPVMYSLGIVRTQPQSRPWISCDV